jgi:hypothetical protein
MILMGHLSQHQEDHGVYPWVNWSSGAGCSPLRGVWSGTTGLPVGLHDVRGPFLCWREKWDTKSIDLLSKNS